MVCWLFTNILSSVAKYWVEGLEELGGGDNETALGMAGLTAERGELDRGTTHN